MKIGIIGAGAIGILFGGYLAEAHHDITFYTRNPNVKHLYIEKERQVSKSIKCTVVHDIQPLYTMDLIIIAVKYHHLKQLKVVLDSLPTQVPLLFLQNGLLHLSFSSSLNQETILIGSVLHGASKINPTTVKHLGIGPTTIGTYRGKKDIMDVLVQSSSPDFPFLVKDHIEDTLFKKALLNCLINPLTTIARVENGVLLTNSSYAFILKSIFNELMLAFSEWNGQLLWEDVVTLCQKTANNRSSMLTDYENGRLMELETIVGAVILEASKRESELPVLNTLYLLLKEMNRVGEEHY